MSDGGGFTAWGRGPDQLLRLSGGENGEWLEMTREFSQITVGRHAHMSSAEVEEMCAERVGVEEITDACAVTIASWYQSPGPTGIAFAGLASSGSADVDTLLENIFYARKIDVPALPEGERDAAKLQLDMLATWALRKVDGSSD